MRATSLWEPTVAAARDAHPIRCAQSARSVLRPPPAAVRADCPRQRIKPRSLAIRCGAIRFKSRSLSTDQRDRQHPLTPKSSVHNALARSRHRDRSKRSGRLSPVRDLRTLGLTSGGRKRCQRGGRGTGTVAKAVGNCESLHPRRARLSSTLQLGLSQARPRRVPRPLPLRDPGAVTELRSPGPVRARGDGRQGQQRKSYRSPDIRIPCEVPKALPGGRARLMHEVRLGALRPFRSSLHSLKSPLTSNTDAQLSLE